VATSFSLVAKLRPRGKAPLLCRPLLSRLLLCGIGLAPFAAVAATPEPPPAIGANPPAVAQDATSEVLVEANEPKYVAPTLRDRIGRIWAPVLINGKGPFRLVLDTGASHSAIISRVADHLGVTAQADNILVRGVTGSAVVPAVRVDRMEVGDLLIEPSTLPIVPDVFGGAEGVLGREGLPDKRIFADFGRDRLVISRSHREQAMPGFSIIPLKQTKAGLLGAQVRVGSIRTLAIIDTGAQQTVGNLALREALMKHPPKDTISEDIIGVTLDMQHGDSIGTPPIELGTLKLRNVRVTFADMFLFNHLNMNREPTMLIGMDVLGSFDVLIIDYRMKEMQIKTRGAIAHP
jgi:predicted aspartyl protease